MKKLRFLWEKMFILNAWTIGYREIEDNRSSLPSQNERAQYRAVKINDHMYFADPFVFEDGKDVYLFAESMNRYRGIASISVAKYDGNGHFNQFKEILIEPFHLSYPNVFSLNGKYYMIPETSAVKQVRLYEANNFPYGWELKKVLLDDGKAYTDNAIFFDDGKVFFVSYYEDKDNNGISTRYILNSQTLELEKCADEIELCNGRPAGNPFCIQGRIYRPIQDCEEYYGKAIYIQGLYDGKEKTVERINADSYRFSPGIKRITGTHTLNRSNHFEVVDIRMDRVCFSRRWIWLYKKYRQLRH